MQTPTPAFYDSLPLTLDFIHSELSNAVKNRRHPLHQLYLATVQGVCPELRTIVLRQASLPRALMRFHTDFRSDKIQEINKNSQVSLLGYHPSQKYQLRFKGTVGVHNRDVLCEEIWGGLSASSKRCYCIDPGPGSLLQNPGSGLPAELEGFAPNQQQWEKAFQNFAIGIVRFDVLDWVFLHAQGSRRAQFTWKSKKEGQELLMASSGDGIRVQLENIWEGQWRIP
jgi:3-hydroxyisobutyrate dehydrogenase